MPVFLAVLQVALASVGAGAIAQGSQAPAPHLAAASSHEVAPGWLIVRVRPSRIQVGGGESFDARQLIAALASRLEPSGYRVALAGTPQARRATRAWSLEVAQTRLGVRLVLRDPDRRPVVIRRIPLERYRPHDLVQAISLSTLEGMAYGVEDLPPEEQLPMRELLAESIEEDTAAPESDPTEEETIPTAVSSSQQALRRPRVAMGVDLAATLTVPGDHVLGGVGTSLRLDGELFSGRAAARWWNPASASGDGYLVEAQPVTLFLGAGARRRWGRLELGGDLGLSGRGLWEKREGTRVVPVRRWLFAPGVGGQLYAAWFPLSSAGLGVSLEAARYLSFPRYQLQGIELLDVGGTMINLGVSVLISQ